MFDDISHVDLIVLGGPLHLIVRTRWQKSIKKLGVPAVVLKAIITGATASCILVVKPGKTEDFRRISWVSTFSKMFTTVDG